MKLKFLLLAAGLAGAVSAHANDYNLNNITGTIIPPQIISHNAGLFEDNFFFSLSGPAIGTGTVANFEVASGNPAKPYFNIDGSTFSSYLYRDLGTVGKADGADTGFLLGTGNYIHSSGFLTAGNYYIKISGNAVGSLGGTYVAQANAVPVPEPDTYAMMFAGLGVIGGIARRRQRK